MSKSFSESELRELAKVYHRTTAATSLLTRVGLDRDGHPSWDSQTSLEFWRAVGAQVASGWGGSDTAGRILAAAAEDYPGNDVFGRSTEGRPRGFLAPGPAGSNATGGPETPGGSDRVASPFRSPDPSGPAAALRVHGTIVVVDAVGFSRNGALVHLEWRTGIGAITARAAAAVGIPPELMHFNDRGDGYMLVIDGRIPAEAVVADFTRELGIALGEYNRTRNSTGRIRLRIAMHEGRAFVDGTGLTGMPAIVAARLVDAEELRRVLKESDAPDSALIVSDALYQSTVTERLRGLAPEDFVRVEVSMEKYDGVAWIAGRGRVDAARAGGSTEAGQPAPGAPPVPAPAESRWDYLISCTEADQGWGQWIAYQLRAAGYTVHLDAFDLVAGTGRVAKWHEAVRHSTRTIAVLSESYLAAAGEIQAAQWQAAWESDGARTGKSAGDGENAGGGVERRLIPVMVRPCRPDGLLGGITPIDLTGRRRDGDAARDHLLDEIRAAENGRRRLPDSPPPFPGGD